MVGAFKYDLSKAERRDLDPPTQEETYGLPGKVEVGDRVKTLNRRRAIYGRVIHIDLMPLRATVQGEAEPGYSEGRVITANVEDLAILEKGTE